MSGELLARVVCFLGPFGGLAFPNYFTAWQDGAPIDAAAAAYAKTLLEQLSWWAHALRSARAAVPYPGGA